MLRSFSMSGIGLLLLLVPAQLMAGGPARLYLPIAGVTADNTAACAELLLEGLEGEPWRHASRTGVDFKQHEGQWYVIFYLARNAEVKLSDVDAALQGSDFSVPRDRLRFFGPVQLVVDAPAAAHESLLKELAALKHVTIEQSSRTESGLLVTMILPQNGRRNILHLHHLLKSSSPDSSASATSTTIESFPSYATLNDLVTRHDARLSDVRWSGQWICRVLGALAVAVEGAKPL